MIKIYTVSSCTSCKKAKTWLNAHQLSYKEQNLGKEGITREELLDILTKTDNGIASIVSSKNRYAKALGVDIEDLSVNEVLNLIMETPRILKSPILVDEKRLQVGYKEQNLGKEGITREELLDILTKTDNGIASIVSSKNRYAKALGVDIEDLSVNEVLNLIMETPRILKSPILVDEKRLQVGYKEDDIRAFLPRSVRNVENAEARLRAAL